MEFHNYMEDAVENVLDDIFSEREDICKCAKCKLDIMALALNQLPAKYVVTHKGRIYAKLQNINIQFKTDIVREVAKSVERVKGNPQH